MNELEKSELQNYIDETDHDELREKIKSLTNIIKNLSSERTSLIKRLKVETELTEEQKAKLGKQPDISCLKGINKDELNEEQENLYASYKKWKMMASYYKRKNKLLFLKK